MINRIKTNKAPKAIGAYSQASIHNGLIYTSGQIGIDPITGELVDKDFKAETLCVLQNLKSVIEAGGGNIDKIKPIRL